MSVSEGSPASSYRGPKWAENRKPHSGWPHSGHPLSRRLGYHPYLPVDLKDTPLQDLYRPFEDVALLDSFVWVPSLRYPRPCESSLSQDLLPCMTLMPRLSSDISPSFSPLCAHIVAEPHHQPDYDDDSDDPRPGQATGRNVRTSACSDARRRRWSTSWLRSRPSSGYPMLFTRVRERYPTSPGSRRRSGPWSR